ncbi:RE2, partial [Symbiodinium microadriaticum]
RPPSEAIGSGVRLETWDDKSVVLANFFCFRGATMDKDYDASLAKCGWDGDPSGWTDFVSSDAAPAKEEPQAEATGEDEDHPEHPSLSPEDEDSFDPGVDAKSSWRRRKDKKKDDEDDESDDSAAMLADLEVWDRYEEGLQEVLPPEVLGWLLLRRANLPTSARLSIQAAAGNSLLFTDIERAMRAMEDELMVHDDSRRQPQHQKRRSFWVEEDGDWSLILAPEEDLQDVISSSEILHIGSRLPQDVYFHQEPDAFQGQLEAGFWHQEDDGAYSYWELAEDGEYYMQDSSGLFWAWNDWDELGTTVSGGGPADGSKESEDAFSLSDPKSRTFTQARQAVRAQKLSRGFYPFNPSTKGKPRGKGKGKGKSKSKGFSSKSHAAPVLAATGEIYAQPGDPSFTGCFVCGAKDHSWRSCPKRSGPSKGGGKGKGGRNFFSESIFMIRSENDEPQPKDQILEYPAMQTPPFSSGATETVGSLPAIEDLGANRVDLGVYSLDVEKVPILIGIRTLKALRTVLDCSQAVAVFAALDATVGVRLRRSASGHLLLDLSKNWLQDSFSILAPTAGILIASTEPQDQEKKEDSVFVVEPDPVSFHPESHADPHVQAPSEAVELPAVLFHSRGSGHSAPVATAVNSGDFTSDPFWVLRALLAGHGSPDRERLQQEAKAKETKPKETKEKAPELDWDRIEEGNPKDARLHGSPCHGSHQIKTRSNQHAMWQWCERCGVRLCYVPRVGKTGLHRAAGPLAADVQSITYEVSQAEELAYNPRLKDQAIGLQAAENSALRQLERIRAQKEKVIPKNAAPVMRPSSQTGLAKASGPIPNGPAPSLPTVPAEVVDVDQEAATLADPENLPVNPANKRHQASPTESLEYAQRTGEACAIDKPSVSLIVTGCFISWMSEILYITLVKKSGMRWSSWVALVTVACVNYYVSKEAPDMLRIFSQVLTLEQKAVSNEPFSNSVNLGLKLHGFSFPPDLPDACHMWQQLAEDGRAFEWQCGDFQVRTTSKVLFMECSRVTGTHESREASLDGLYRAVCGSLMNVHGAVNASDVSGMAYAVASQKEALEGVTKSELEGLLDTVQKLHRRFGHPTNSLLVKNLRARGASPKLLAVAAEFKCDVCLENQIRSSAPSASLEREDRLWCALQIDGFYMRFGQEVFHFLLMVDEASGFCQVEEVMRHSEKESRNVTTAQVVRTLESRWCQLFGFPETIKLDPEGAFRGLDLGEYCASRGIELGFVPAEYHQGISEAERTIGTIRRKIETFLRAEQYAPSRAAAQLVAAHNTLARTSGFSPAQWAFGRDASITGHSRERDGEMCARSAMADPSHAMHEALELRTKAEKAFLEYRARDLASRALNSKTRPSKHFLPGDIIFYQRFQTPQDTPANTTVDRPRLNIARFYGPGRVLATETRVESEDGVRKAGAIVWAVCNGRLKKFHHSQVRHASETERLVAEGSNAVAFPWTFASLADLLEKGSYDDESIPRHRPRGRSRTPARSRSLPPTARRRIDMPEPPVPQDSPSLRLPEDPPEDEELIEVPASSGAKRDAPEPSMDEDMELIPAPDSKGGDGASSINMARFLNDPQYFPVNFVNLEAEDEASLFQIASTSENHEACSGSVLAVTLEAPATEAEWKSLVKNPKKFLAKSVQKGVEVSYAKLNPQQRRAMDEAMKVEVDNWMKTMAVKAARQYVPQRELLKMRWVLTFKSAAQESNDDNGGSSGVHKDNATKGERIKAKARIVILGYSDPNLLEATTVSPAMTRLSRQLLLNMAAVKKWDILCGDVKSAFLQAKSPQADRCIFAAPVPELSKALNLREGQAVQLLRSVYGLVSAPREWYEDVHKTLGTLGAERLATDNCVWRVRDSNTGQIVGLVSSHVDDFLMCGDNSSKVWKDFLFAFGKSYEWSPWEYGHFKHCGVSIMQHPDSSISLDHSAFCQELKQMNPIRGERKLTAEEVSQVKAILGSVQWRVYQTAPQHAAKLSYLQSLIASQDSSIVEQVNKLIREVYASRSLGVQVQALGAGDPEDLCMVGWSDASLANRPDLSSTGGYMIGIMNRRALEAGSGRVNPVSWRSGKLHRIARSSLSAEAQSLADTEQELFFARLEWREMLGDQLDLRQPESCASKVSAYLIVDAKAMFDSLSKGVFVSSQKDKYTGLELLALSQRLEAQKTVLLWCDSDHMLADGLTKASKQDVLKRFLSHGTWRIRYDGAFISAKRRRQMRQTEDSQGAAFLLFNDPLYSADM